MVRRGISLGERVVEINREKYYIIHIVIIYVNAQGKKV